MPVPDDGDEFREGRTRAHAQTLREGATGLFGMIGLNEGARVVHGFVVRHVGQSDGLPKCTVQEAEPKPASYTSACASKPVDIWK